MKRRKHSVTSDPLTDLGNAGRFVREHGQNMLFCQAWGKWLVWDGSRWAVDDTGAVARMAKETVKEMYREAAGTSDSGEQARLARHAIKSQYSSRITAMIYLAQSELGVPARPQDLDTDGFLLNCHNGTINLRTGTLIYPARREDLITKLAPVVFDSDAKCPVFDGFLNRIMGGNESLKSYVQRLVGYSLTGTTREQILCVLFGSGANGKTTFLESIRHVFGDYAGQVPVETLLKKQGEGIPNDIAQLKGLRFVTASEVEEGRKLAEAKVKHLTGTGTLQGRYLHQEFFQFEPSHKIFMDCNHKPVIRGTEHAIWRRIKLVPFTVSIPDEEKDKQLLEKLKAEAPGILAWAVRGCMDWQRDGLQEPASVKAATGDYQEEMDLAKQFVKEQCTLDPVGQELVEDIYRDFVRWCEERGAEPLSKKTFGLALTGIEGLTKGKQGGQRCWKGIRLSASEPDEKAA